MDEQQLADLIYAARNLTETLRDLDLLDKHEEIREYVEDVEGCLDQWAGNDD